MIYNIGRDLVYVRNSLFYLRIKDTPKFEWIGSRQFMIISIFPLRWEGAITTCKMHGGSLAVIQSEEELDAINAKVNSSKIYWLGINDHEKKGEFVSAASGIPAPFLKFEFIPVYNTDKLYCVALAKGKMKITLCNNFANILCQKDPK